MTTKTIRCSALPRIAQCPASATEPLVNIRSLAGEEARLGTASHAAISAWLQPDADYWSVDDIASEHHVDKNDIWPLLRSAQEAWKSLPSEGGERYLERPLSGPFGPHYLTGRPDIYVVNPPALDDTTTAIVVDWKTGRDDFPVWDQLKGYALLICQEHTQVEQVYAAVVRLRDQTIDGRWFSPSELFRWSRELVQRLHHNEYHPGAHCQYCPRAHECPARDQYYQSAVRVIDGEIVSRGHLPRGEELQELYRRVKAVEELCEQIREWIKTETEIAGDRLGAGDGFEFQVSDTTRREIVTERAWDYLVSNLGMARLLNCVKISKSELEKQIMAAYDRGQKKQAKDLILDDLAAKGAISEKVVRRLELRQVPNVEREAAVPLDVLQHKDADLLQKPRG